MKDIYSPYIIGTNHLPYNIKTTISHVESLDMAIKKIMLESYDPNNNRPAIDFQISLGRDGLQFDFQNNISTFFGPLYKHFIKKYEVCFAYSPGESLGKIMADSDDGEMHEVFNRAGEEFGKRINPLILERALRERPELIIIGSAHGEFLNKELSNSSYIKIQDDYRGKIWTANLLARQERKIRKLLIPGSKSE